MAGVEELFPRALAAQRNGDLALAERDYREILALEPNHAVTLSNLSVILGRRGELAEALASAEAATRADPELSVAFFNLGNLLRRLGRSSEAAEAYRRVIQLNPDYAPAHLNLGIATSELGDWSAATNHFRRAVEIQPTIPDGYHNLGESLIKIGSVEEAIPILQFALQQSPASPRSYLALGRALFASERLEEAIHTLEQVLQIEPTHAVAHNFLGVVLDKANRCDEAQAHFREALRTRPEFAGARSNLGLSLVGQGRWTEGVELLTRSLELRPDAAIASTRLFARLGSSELTPTQLRLEHEAWVTQYASAPAPIEQLAGPSDSTGRLRIGYLFGEFLTSVTAKFLEALLSRHDRNQFHISCYSNCSENNATLARLRSLSDGWHSIVGCDDTTAYARIRSDRPDILIDLCGHTVGNRLVVLARKPARIQVALFGYPLTTALPTMDFRITDALADPPGANDAGAAEKVLRLPDCARLYIPPVSTALPGTLPALSRGAITFGCLNDPGKISSLCIETWARILNSVPQSRLVLQAGRSMDTVRSLTDRFAQLGIEPRRLTLIYRLPEADYYHAYQSIDLALDPFPFNGRATTCDALWMGVPVLTVRGDDSRSRQGLSLLANLGLADFVAATPDQLVELATAWANQPAALADLRANLRDMMIQSPLTEAANYVRNLEETFSRVINGSC